MLERMAAPKTFEPDETPFVVKGMMWSSTVERMVVTSFAIVLVAVASVFDGLVVICDKWR